MAGGPFPALAGMTRGTGVITGPADPVPRTRGDDPGPKRVPGLVLPRSPHARG